MFTINSHTEQRVIAPESTALIFDLHGVIAHFSIVDALRNTAHMVLRHPSLMLLAVNPWCWHGLYKTFQDVHPWVPESLFRELVRYVPSLAPVYGDFLAILNSYRVDEQVISYIVDLKSRKYRIILASNIGPDTWQQFLAGGGKQLAHLFDAVFTSAREHGMYKKPDRDYYTTLLQALDSTRSAQEPLYPIFIDDTEKNIMACQQLGHRAICFVNLAYLQDALKA